ncbi:unnamed protein product [Closterium sp. NIES-54]
MAAQEARWLSFLLAELGYPQPVPTLWCDNQSTIHLTKDPVFHGRTKQIEVRHYFLRELVQREQLKAEHIASDCNLADLFTKSLVCQDHYRLLSSMVPILSRETLQLEALAMGVLELPILEVLEFLLGLEVPEVLELPVLEVLELLEREVLQELALEALELELLEVLEPLVPKVLVLEVLELLELVMQQALELATLELELLEALELLVPAVLVLEVLELLELVVLRELELETLELKTPEMEVLALGVLVLLVLELRLLCLVVMMLEALCRRDHTSFPCFNRFFPASPVPAPSPYTEQTRGLTERHEPVSHPALLVCARVPLPSPLESSLAAGPDPESDLVRAAIPSVLRLLAIVVTDPSFESTAASALVTELVDFAAACRLDYAASLVAESESDCPPSVGGEFALGTDVLEDRQEDFECIVAAVPHLVSMLIAPEGDPDAPDIPTPRSYAEAITGPYSSQRQTAMDAEMGSLHEEIWLRRPPDFTGSFPAGTQWILRRPVYGLRQAPREWHNTLRTTLAALGFAPSTADPSMFVRTETSLPPFYVLVYVDDLVFATTDTKALALVKSELHKRHTFTDMGELRSYLGLQITQDRAWHTITLTQSHMVHQVLQRFGFWYSSPQSTPLPAGHLLSAPPSDESVEPSGLYPELVCCLINLMTCT